ncbi:MAG TPA: hypothetical protein VLL25_17355 [Acidimicrobiales bacterium]|nr:hypothetical protein [Acidimicrobiales bacterium]
MIPNRLGIKVWSVYGDDGDHKNGGVVIDMAERTDPEDGLIEIVYTVIDPRPVDGKWQARTITDEQIDPAATEPYSVRTVRNLRRRIQHTMSQRTEASPPDDIELQAFTSRLMAIEFGEAP